MLKISKRDSVGLSKYTDKRTGFYLLYRNGIRDTYFHHAGIGFSDTTFPWFPFYDKIKFNGLNYTTLPQFNCDDQRWSKTGTFTDTTKTDRLLSKTAKMLVSGFGEKISEQTISMMWKLEYISRHIIVADNNGNDIIFYLSFIKGKWFLTIIDKITNDCSA